MTRIRPVDPEKASGKTKELLDGIQSKLGMLPNVFTALATSPEVLQGFVGLHDALEGGVLTAKLRERIGLTVSQANRAEYCLAGHAAIGKAIGLSDDEIIDSRHGRSPDKRLDVALRFARAVIEKRGGVSDQEVTRLRSAGYGDREIAEILGCVALSIFGNYFTQVAQTEVDFPPVPELINA